jgi:hypothetical protein
LTFTFSLYLFLHLSTCLLTYDPPPLRHVNAEHQNVQDWDFEKFPIDLKKYNPIPLDPVKDKKLSEEQKKTLVRLELHFDEGTDDSSPTLLCFEM